MKKISCMKYFLISEKRYNMEKITSSSSTICNISNNQLEISNIGKVVDNDIQKCKFVVLETVVKTDL